MNEVWNSSVIIAVCLAMPKVGLDSLEQPGTLEYVPATIQEEF